jgi:hypothetical protein
MAKTDKPSESVKDNKHDLKRKEYDASYRQLQSQDTRGIYHPLMQKGFNHFHNVESSCLNQPGRDLDGGESHCILSLG